MDISLKKLGSAIRRPRRTWRTIRERYLVPAGFGTWRPLVPADEFSRAFEAAVDRLSAIDPAPLGDYLEFGVSRGTSMACAARILEKRGPKDLRLIGFDSFEGMPAGSEKEGWRPGQYASTEAATRRYLASQGVDLGRVTLVKGWFNQTCTSETRERLKLQRASILMLDCDTYSSTNCALDFSLPLVGQHAVLIFDDWGGQADKGEIGQKEVFEERIAPAFVTEELSSYHPRAHIFLVTRR